LSLGGIGYILHLYIISIFLVELLPNASLENDAQLLRMSMG
jgi:hypothetical protein